MTNGQAPDVVAVGPAPFSVSVAADGKCDDGQGNIVDRIRLIFFDPTGTKVLFMPAPEAVHLANMIRERAGGLAVAPNLRSVQGGDG